MKGKNFGPLLVYGGHGHYPMAGHLAKSRTSWFYGYNRTTPLKAASWLREYSGQLAYHGQKRHKTDIILCVFGNRWWPSRVMKRWFGVPAGLNPRLYCTSRSHRRPLLKLLEKWRNLWVLKRCLFYDAPVSRRANRCTEWPNWLLSRRQDESRLRS